MIQTRSGVAFVAMHTMPHICVRSVGDETRRTSCLNVERENIVCMLGWSQMYKNILARKLQKSNIS